MLRTIKYITLFCIWIIILSIILVIFDLKYLSIAVISSACLILFILWHSLLFEITILQDAIDRIKVFIFEFEKMFNNYWGLTKHNICNHKDFIEEDGTFLKPRIENEYENWNNRGRLLKLYRDLKEQLRIVDDGRG